jgi:hypothetical protein
MILFRLVSLPFRLMWGTTKISTRSAYRAGRLVGYRRIFFFSAGVAVGLLVAPTTGEELRRKLQETFADYGGGVATAPSTDNLELAERVRQHVRQAPRTWHLPQPVITEVSPGVIRLDGAVADETARRDLEVTAQQVDGVAEVDARLVVTGPAGATASGD